LPDYRPEPLHHLLGDEFFDVVESADFPRHVIRYRNDRWAERVGLNELDDEEWIRHFGAFEPLPDNLPRPLALRYHGHQFQSYNPDLGDGRGFLFAQLRDYADGRLLDLGTKGSGETPWSRSGDGRLTLKGGVREVLATAQLEALGVYTSKTFSLIETGESLIRGDEPSPTRSSVMVRLSHSHIRFGTFQRQAYLGREENIRKLVDHSIAHYYPELAEVSSAERAALFLRAVVLASAELAAAWMATGFVHGVLNTDNLNITGESFDYGPYRFLPKLDPRFTAAYFDRTGLYAYGRQPEAVAWNLQRLAETLLPISERADLVSALEVYPKSYLRALRLAMMSRLGLEIRSDSSSEVRCDELIEGVQGFLLRSGIGYEQFFFDWYGGLASRSRAQRSPSAASYRTPEFARIEALFADFECSEPAVLESAYFERELPCTLLIDEIESLWSAIAERDDWSLYEAKLAEIDEMRASLLAGLSVPLGAASPAREREHSYPRD